jgi:hypothetical protein
VDIGDLDIAGTSVARGQDGEVASLEQAVGDFERELLQRCMPATRRRGNWPGACKLRTPPSPSACVNMEYPEKA